MKPTNGIIIACRAKIWTIVCAVKALRIMRVD